MGLATHINEMAYRTFKKYMQLNSSHITAQSEVEIGEQSDEFDECSQFI